MAGLNDLDPTNPDNKDLLSQGALNIRLVITKLIEFAQVEHALSGEHTLPRGTIAARPAVGNAGRLYILEVVGVAKELQFDTGTAWVTLTSNQAVLDYATALSTHQTATVLDHPNSSVTAAKIKAGAILKKHLDGGSDLDSLAVLVNGSNADAFHEHAFPAASGVGNKVEITSGGSWSKPAGVDFIWISACAAGGGGGGGRVTQGGNGGAGGAWIYKIPFDVTGISSITHAIGSGGAAGAGAADGSAGGSTTITIGGRTITLLGGSGGLNGSGTEAAGGVKPTDDMLVLYSVDGCDGGVHNGASDGIGNFFFDGGTSTVGTYESGGGGAGLFGAGADSVGPEIVGADGGDNTGAGASGGGGYNNYKAGGVGGSGKIEIYY
jgi:hypothetical protein